MDADQLADDCWTTVRTCWREERWLPAGLAVAAVAYALWIGLTGAALSFLASAMAGTLTFRPWTSLSTVAVATISALWIAGPAALATLLVLDRVTNLNGNLRTGYRLRHPVLLLAPPLLVLGLAAAIFVATGSLGPVSSVALVVAALWLAVRTAAYAYRVFSLSLPVVAWATLFATAVALSLAVLVYGGLAIGRGPLLEAVLSGVATRTGVPTLATLHSATYPVVGVSVPLLVGVTVAIPLATTGVYVALQVPWSLLTRVRAPTVKRPELRTGQRYPRFARPTTTPSSPTPTPNEATGGRQSGGSTSKLGAAEVSTRTDDGAAKSEETAEAGADPTDGDVDEEPDDGATDEIDEVTHTRVFTPPADADLDAPDVVTREPADGGGAEETRVVDGSDEAHCPGCGDAVGASATACPHCGADLS